MTLSHLNFFVPFERAPAWHENQLTRALLVVLRNSPMAHQTWLRLVAPELNLQELSKAEFVTQRQRVLGHDTQIPDGEAIRGISVWLAPDASLVTSPVESSDRQQILDGIITYGNDLVVVIENKVAWGGVTEQPHQLNLHGSPVTFASEPVPIAWQQLLGAFSALVERELVTGAERWIISDFLDFVEENFPNIGPYSTLAQCGEQRFRVERRLDTIIGKVIGIEDGKTLGWRDLAESPMLPMVWLGFSKHESAVHLQAYPADTLGQARAFYGDASAVKAVLALQSEGWHVEPNFHWGFMAKGLAGATTPLPVKDYCAYWLKEIGTTREIARAEWEEYWATLEADKIVDTAGKDKFDTEFTRSKREKAHPRPGLLCEYKWPLAAAQRIDSQKRFVEDVRARLNSLLTALGAPTVSGQ